MKLSTKSAGRSTILTVQGGLDDRKLPALRVGILQWVKEGKKVILLDLSHDSSISADAIFELTRIQWRAFLQDGLVLLIHPKGGLNFLISELDSKKVLGSREAFQAFQNQLPIFVKSAFEGKVAELTAKIQTRAQDKGQLEEARKEAAKLKHAFESIQNEGKILNINDQPRPELVPRGEKSKMRNEMLDQMIEKQLLDEFRSLMRKTNVLTR